jgi:hypothetical protein
LLKTRENREILEISQKSPYTVGHDYPSLRFHIAALRVCATASLELELIALRHQVSVLLWQRAVGFPPRCWVGFYRLWPQVLSTLVLVKPATAVKWHRKGFRAA